MTTESRERFRKTLAELFKQPRSSEHAYGSREPWLESLVVFAHTKSDADFARFVKESSECQLWSLFTAWGIGRTEPDREDLIQKWFLAIYCNVHSGTMTTEKCHMGYIRKMAINLRSALYRYDDAPRRRPDRPMLRIGPQDDGSPPIDPPDDYEPPSWIDLTDDSEPPSCIDLPILGELPLEKLPKQEQQYYKDHYCKGLQGQELEHSLGLTAHRVRGLKDRFERKCKLLIGLKAIHKQKQVSDRDYTIFIEDQIWDLLKPETAERNDIAQREIQPRVIRVLDLINDWLDANGAERVTLSRTKTKPVKDG